MEFCDLRCKYARFRNPMPLTALGVAEPLLHYTALGRRSWSIKPALQGQNDKKEQLA